MAKYINKLLFILFSFNCLAQQAIPEIEVLSEQFPPFNYTVNKEVHGTNTALVKQLLDKLQINADIQFLPWGRAYYIAQTRPNTLIFSIARNSKREQQFHWVGLLSEANACVFSLKANTGLKSVNTLEQAKKYRVATQKESHMSQILLKENFISHQNFLQTNSVEHAIKLLRYQRADFIGYPKEVLYYHLKKQGIVPEDLIQLNFCVESPPLYLAFSLDTPLTTVERFRDAFAQVKVTPNQQ